MVPHPGVFCCLASGAALILRNDAMLAGAPAFLGACASWGVTVCDLPTVFWQELVDRVDAGEAAWPPSLRLLVFGGERALPERVARLRRQLGPAVRVINSYGPTEVTVAATSHAVHGEPDGPPRPLRELREFPIGRPLQGARAYVLDGARELCPPGIPGELAIGGLSLARGYLGRPDLTASTFLPDPFAAARARGCTRPAIWRATVLKSRLPEPAVPSLFALLPALPRNASGKLDRRALPTPKLEAASAGGYEAPATPTEEAVAMSGATSWASRASGGRTTSSPWAAALAPTPSCPPSPGAGARRPPVARDSPRADDPRGARPGRRGVPPGRARARASGGPLRLGGRRRSIRPRCSG